MNPPFATTPAILRAERPDTAELLSDLTLDELRELPVRMQMGLDLTACESDISD